jgi:hypothetical protein
VSSLPQRDSYLPPLLLLTNIVQISNIIYQISNIICWLRFDDLFCLIRRCADSVKHFQIGRDGDQQYTFGMGKFASLNEFVQHFENKPLIGGQSG